MHYNSLRVHRRECTKNKMDRGAERLREGGGWRVRRARVDVKNEPTRCERIDELALLKRACIRAAEMKEEKKRERERVTFVNVQPRSPSSSASIKLLFPLVVRSSSLFSFFCFFLHLFRNFTSPENTLRKVVSGLTRTMASARVVKLRRKLRDRSRLNRLQRDIERLRMAFRYIIMQTRCRKRRWYSGWKVRKEKKEIKEEKERARKVHLSNEMKHRKLMHNPSAKRAAEKKREARGEGLQNCQDGIQFAHAAVVRYGSPRGKMKNETMR